jgi:hypothetical protein
MSWRGHMTNGMWYETLHTGAQNTSCPAQTYSGTEQHSINAAHTHTQAGRSRNFTDASCSFLMTSLENALQPRQWLVTFWVKVANQEENDRQSTYNVIFRRVCVTIVAWKKNNYYVIYMHVCNLSYPACKTHALCYIVICGQSGSATFFHMQMCIGLYIKYPLFLSDFNQT